MTSHLLSFPGHSCRFHAAGRCVLEERQNPGLEQRWRCRVLQAWGKAYDQLLDQAEIFSLDDETAMAIWNRRMQTLATPQQWCGEYVYCPDQEEGFPNLHDGEQEVVTVDCLHGLEDLCVLELPICHGVCASFVPRHAPDAANTPTAP